VETNRILDYQQDLICESSDESEEDKEEQEPERFDDEKTVTVRR
jgi:hypothetical protein